MNSKPGYFLYNQRYLFNLAGIKVRGDRGKEDLFEINYNHYIGREKGKEENFRREMIKNLPSGKFKAKRIEFFAIVY